MKKKIFALLCVLALAMTMFAGCSKSEEKKAEAPATEAPATEAPVTEAPATEAPSPEATNSDETAGSEDADTSTSEADTTPTDINVITLKGPTAMGMVDLMKKSENGETATNNYNFTLAAAADEISPAIVQGTVDIAAVPANLASVLYNKTQGAVKVLAVNTLGVLYIVENGDTIHSVSDLKGRTIYASGKGATPEYALNFMLTSNGIDPSADVTIEYKAEHAECVSALESDPEGVAMLPQPFVTVAQLSNDKTRIALDMNAEWNAIAEANGSDATLITGVVIVRSAFAQEHPEAVELFLQQYNNSVAYTNENIEDAAALIENYGIIKAAVAKKAIPFCNITFIAGSEMKTKLSGYLGELFNQNPAAVGGALPGEDFYY